MILRTIAGMLSPEGRKGLLSIVIFHRVLAQRDPVVDWDLDARDFEQRLRWLRNWFNILPLDEAVTRLAQRSLPARAAAVTFDDGYADNFAVALPILRRLGVPATFFIATGYLDGGRMWNDTIIHSVRHCGKARLDLSAIGLGAHELTSIDAIRRAIDSIVSGLKYRPPEQRSEAADYVARVAGCRLPDDLMMRSEDVRAMRRAGMLIGAHTVTHPILARVDADAARKEVLHSKQYLEGLLQERVGLFAYPNGKPTVDYRAEDVESIRALDFDAAVTTAWGVADADSDRLQLPRFTPWDRTRLRFGVRMMRNMFDHARQGQ
ncbi:MAG TPA: polysaccharide deacetylase family protein [Candidatus Accumulibacter phosphatis]|nr:MAG: polysaccharide deacetylase family sporulation protein PdaB [Candidatus Accumulibacter sp. SK-11]HAY29064.1 carbohydrate esterase family protein [Accumulibacter sp.]HCN70086.1 carbohydrate esterase family protein [Accumulibacter sp.]HRL75727.1 polysaccharide deacetylase family protein [Candidatus Accumulibacter phosphatis]HRQ93947.1 polysaccharide deacetylase family protein [Candidatus Accumulibacter phosphatis]